MAKSKDNLTKLAQWTQKIDFTTSRDPLGLANRVSQRLIHQLLFGITAIGNRARYYSYALWAIHDVIEREKPVSSKEMMDGIYWRDSAFMAACLIHHGEDDYDLDGVIGKDKGAAYLKDAGDLIDLGTIKHIESNPEGGFGLNYKGSLINLGFFYESYYDNSQQDTTYEIANQPAIKKMLTTFCNHIKNTTFYQEYACKREPVPRNVLQELGQKICICLLSTDNAPERIILRDILYERTKDYQPQESFRPSSLRLLLYCAKICSDLKISFTEKQFRSMIYFGEYTDQDNKSLPIQFDKGVDEIVNRWRIFFMHHYFSNALEGIFVALLNILSESIENALTLNQIIESLIKAGIADLIKDTTGCINIVFDKTSIGELLTQLISDKQNFTNSSWMLLNAERPISEENLVNNLSKIVKKSSHSETVSRCLIAIIILMERCAQLEGGKYWGWAISVSKGDYAKSISAPVMYLHLNQIKKTWRDITLKEFLEIILRRFIIEQHELMVPEKKGGVSWLTYDEGCLFYENSFDGPSPGSSRFNSARQIICDLGLMKLDDNNIPQLSPDADFILSEILEGSSK